MFNQDTQAIIDIILNTDKREKYIHEKPLKKYAKSLEEYKKDILKGLLQGNVDKLEVCERFCWAFSFFGEGLSENETLYGIVRARLFGLLELGIPRAEMTLLNSAIVDFFKEYSLNIEEDPRRYESFKKAEELFQLEREKLSQDPRYKEIFDALNLGIFR